MPSEFTPAAAAATPGAPALPAVNATPAALASGPKKYRVGFTLGKFAPFHKGHQLLVETALAECERVIVLIYETRATSIPLPMRAEWIRALYPQVEVIEGPWAGPEHHSSERSHKKLHEDYCRALLGTTQVDAFYSSEFYGAHMARALGAVDRRVDEARAALPVSGTAVRNDPYGMRSFVDPLVYRDLITKVCFMGAPSCGKTTIVEELAQRHNTTRALEYGHEYWTEHERDRRLEPWELEHIARVHQQREEVAFANARDVCFVDTNAITTYMFALDYHRSATPGLARLAAENATRYDLFFLCEDDIPYDDTPDRSGPPEARRLPPRHQGRPRRAPHPLCEPARQPRRAHRNRGPRARRVRPVRQPVRPCTGATGGARLAEGLGVGQART